MSTNQFTVEQKTGQDSLVTVYEETNYLGYQMRLRFETDQILTSQSDRTWNVNKAIRNYAQERGYRIETTDKHEAIAVYDKDPHGHVETWKVKKAIQSDPRYQEAARAAEQERDKINGDYGRAIRLLRNLIFALEERNRKELDRITAGLVAVQVEVVQGLTIPTVVNDLDRKQFEYWPLVKIEADHYANCGVKQGELPAEFDSIMALLEMK